MLTGSLLIIVGILICFSSMFVEGNPRKQVYVFLIGLGAIVPGAVIFLINLYEG